MRHSVTVAEHPLERLRAVLSRLGTVLSRRDPLGVAVAVAIGIGAFYLVQAIVSALIAPLIAVFIGDSHFELNEFTINGVEFRYGIVIEYVLSFVAILGLSCVVLSTGGKESGRDGPESGRGCPECTMSIPSEATRCPHCTARVPSSEGDG